MKGSMKQSIVVAALGVIILAAQGCGMKWLQSEGDGTGGSPNGRAESGLKGRGEGGASGQSGSEWNGQGVNPNFPGMAQGGSNNELSGFSHNPSEERLTQGAFAYKTPSGMNVMQHAELTKEEKAAIEAGLQDVFFGYDQWTLSDHGMAALNHDAKWLKEHPSAVLKVEGHCDERGTTDYNVVLGDKRSKSARTYLLDLGVSPKQIGVVSYGKERPFCMDHTESCYQQNRRGHMLLKVKQ